MPQASGFLFVLSADSEVNIQSCDIELDTYIEGNGGSVPIPYPFPPSQTQCGVENETSKLSTKTANNAH